jgi:phage I-like protein
VLEGVRQLVAARITAERFDATMGEAIDEGRALPAQRPSFQRLFKRDPETALRGIRSLKPVTVAAPARSLTPGNVDPAALDLDRRIRAHALEHDVSYAAAFEAVRGSRAGREP